MVRIHHRPLLSPAFVPGFFVVRGWLGAGAEVPTHQTKNMERLGERAPRRRRPLGRSGPGRSRLRFRASRVRVRGLPVASPAGDFVPPPSRGRAPRCCSWLSAVRVLGWGSGCPCGARRLATSSHRRLAPVGVALRAHVVLTIVDAAEGGGRVEVDAGPAGDVRAVELDVAVGAAVRAVPVRCATWRTASAPAASWMPSTTRRFELAVTASARSPSGRSGRRRGGR